MQETQDHEKPAGASPVIIFSILAVIIGGSAIYLLSDDKSTEQPISEQMPEQAMSQPVVEDLKETAPIVPEPIIEPEPFEAKPPVETVTLEKPEPVVNLLPSLDESDSWFKEQLNKISWRKELTKLVISDDTIRRFVVFTDNFANGVVAYEHTPLKLPKEKFSALELDGDETIVWDEQSSKRFEKYVQLLRSVETDKIVQWYIEAKPLVDEAYAELGYPDSDFTETLQLAIERVLNSETMQSHPELIRPSVMYKFADKELESLSEVDKLLIRIGKENLVMVKDVLSEVNAKLNQNDN